MMKKSSSKAISNTCRFKTGTVGASILTATYLGLNAVVKGITKVSKEAMEEAGEAIDKTSRKILMI